MHILLPAAFPWLLSCRGTGLHAAVCQWYDPRQKASLPSSGGFSCVLSATCARQYDAGRASRFPELSPLEFTSVRDSSAVLSIHMSTRVFAVARSAVPVHSPSAGRLPPADGRTPGG